MALKNNQIKKKIHEIQRNKKANTKNKIIIEQ